MSDPILDALTSAAQRSGPQAPAGATGPATDPVLAALQARADGTAQVQAPPGPWYGVDNLKEQARSAGAAFGHHLMRPLHGAAQLVENGVAAAAGLLPDNPVSRQIINTAKADNQAAQRWEQGYQATTPNNIGAYTGAVAGEVAPFVVTGAARGLQAVGDYVGSKLLPQSAPALARIASGATQGALLGAAAPVTNGQPYWEHKGADVALGAAAGGALPAIAAPVSAAWNAGKRAIANSPLINPGQYAARQVGAQLGDDLPAVVNNLRTAPEHVPSSLPTSAQAGMDPRLVMMEKSLANQSPAFKAGMLQRDIANNEARLAQVASVAGSPGELDAAIASRQAVAGKNYGQAFEAFDPAKLTPEMQASIADLMKRPAIQDAMKQARIDALNQGMPLTDDTSIKGLHFAKMALDNAIGKAAKFGDDTTGLLSSRDKLLGVIQGLSEPYANARSTYAAMSPPIDSMRLGQALQETLGNASLNGAGTPAVTFPTYRQALARGLKAAEFDIQPEARAALEGVQQDLQRATISSSVRTPGSDTAFNQGAGKHFLQALGAGGGAGDLSHMATAGGAAGLVAGSPKIGAAAAVGAKKLSNLTTDRVSTALAELLLDPKKLAEALAPAVAPPSSGPLWLSQWPGRLPGIAATGVFAVPDSGQQQPVAQQHQERRPQRQHQDQR